jgi:prepilin-type N-terminal cleavage/methylation domain-containing protein/prepilin-type processing-associated H-X9-DG protein
MQSNGPMLFSRLRPLRAFTLVELLVVIGIIALLMGVLLPALANARAQARLLKCQAQIHQISLVLLNYAADNHGKFPPNTTIPAPGASWCDADRIGLYLPNPANLTSGIGGGVLACPDDENSARSYAMNIWASSKVDSSVINSGTGELWTAATGQGASLILVAETWSSQGTGPTYGRATIGAAGSTPGQRFGAGVGISPLVTAGAFGKANCELSYLRHRRRGSTATGVQPSGRVHIGYADGHAELKSESQLADFATGRATGDSLWSPIDPQLDK